MDKIKEKYLKQINEYSDINEHIETLYQFGSEVSHITEMGVRWVSSTWPLLYSKPKKMVSYDIITNPNIYEVIELANEYDIDYKFIEKDVLDVEIENTELLFIDTLHTYNQLYNELLKHSSKSSKYIILHDTESFGQVDEVIYAHASIKIQEIEKNKEGLMNAITDFLTTELGNNWVIYKHYTNNNGLTILKRK